DNFYDLYIAMRNLTTDPKKFKEDTKNWLKFFLTPSTGTPNNIIQGLYQLNDLTPYIHIFIYHIHELIKKHNK
ncbi:2267_t:CDS:1, partial [Racocetra fulgida]